MVIVTLPFWLIAKPLGSGVGPYHYPYYLKSAYELIRQNSTQYDTSNKWLIVPAWAMSPMLMPVTNMAIVRKIKAAMIIVIVAVFIIAMLIARAMMTFPITLFTTMMASMTIVLRRVLYSVVFFRVTFSRLSTIIIKIKRVLLTKTMAIKMIIIATVATPIRFFIVIILIVLSSIVSLMITSFRFALFTLIIASVIISFR